MSVRVLQGDCRDVLKSLPDESVHCVVTSPPYWGLRDYGTAKWEGGDTACDHVQPVSYKSSTLGASTGGRSEETHRRSIGAQATPYRDECRKCGANRVDSQIGLEDSPQAFVASMVQVFQELRRVLRSDGTAWLNLGDSYAGGGNYRGVHSEATLTSKQRSNREARGLSQQLGAAGKDFGLEPKNLVGIPWRVALALQAAGWWLRQDIIWHKPNPMPESILDRCTKAHEYIFLLAKAERYYYDAAAIAEPSVAGFNGSSFTSEYDKATKPGLGQGERTEGDTRNKRSVWTVATQAFREAHFATFPPDLIEPCILAGCPEGGTVLDPFGGAGTTGLVADRHHRDAILIELNPEYAEMARKRITNDAPLFADVE